MSKLSRDEVEKLEELMIRKAMAGEYTEDDDERLEQAQKDLRSIVTNDDEQS